MTVASAWREGRSLAATKAERRDATRRLSVFAIIYTVVKIVAAKVPLWRRVRSAVLTWCGLGFLSYAAWQWNWIVGCAAIGLSLLVIEALGGDR